MMGKEGIVAIMRKNLIETFKRYLENKDKNIGWCGYNNNYNSPARGYSPGERGKIYFYEWSNIYSTPRAFDTLADFERFLNNDCGIYLMQWQRESLLAYGTNKYVTCKEGCKELIIRHYYENLKQAFSFAKT